jgi:recombination protein RecR
MPSFPHVLEDLIETIAEFPGIGRKSAERIVLFMVKMDAGRRKKLSSLIAQIEQHVKPCRICNNFSAEEECPLCKSLTRNKLVICVTEEPRDVWAIEKTHVFNGVYHVLLGSLSPLEGRGPESLDIPKLIKRISAEKIHEVIIATDSDAEGEATALYLYRELSKHPVKVSRLSIGMPVGVQLEYLDTTTLSKALLERRAFK